MIGDDANPEVPVMRLDEVHGQYDFVDFGSGTGESLAPFEERFGGRGLGIELDEQKVREARQLGRAVVLGDIRDLGPNEVRFVTMDNVLEHLPTLESVYGVLEHASQIASEFTTQFIIVIIE